MIEVEAVANKLGMELPISIDQRIAGAEKVGEHKTSMLQDLEAGRPLELEPVVGAVVELGERLGVEMPHTRTVYACTKLLERQGGDKKVKPLDETHRGRDRDDHDREPAIRLDIVCPADDVRTHWKLSEVAVGFTVFIAVMT